MTQNIAQFAQQRDASAMNRTLVWYYAATSVFLVLDFVLHINVRLAFLEPLPTARIGYYGVCFACFALMIWRPAWTVLIATFESLVTLIALIISMAMKTMLVTDSMLETGTGLVTIEELINFLIAGTAAYWAWFRGLRALIREKKL